VDAGFELNRDGRTSGHTFKLVEHGSKICATISSVVNRSNQLDDTVDASPSNSCKNKD